MPAELSAYEQQRLKNIAENRKVLEQLGIFKKHYERLKNIAENRKVLEQLDIFKKFQPNKVFQKPVKRKRPSETAPRKKARKAEDINVADQGSSYGLGRRTSRRLAGQTAPSKSDVDAELSKAEAHEDADYKPKPVKRENTFGAIPGVEVGTHWDMRMECSRDGIHRPTVAGIHGNEHEGCYSVAMSGGYEDDLDLGECFTFTGEGGRDLKGTKSNPKNLRTAPQSKDQTLTRGNMALSKNVENRQPVRVIRGYKSNSPFAPDEGYRYDGLYTVEKFWFTTGLSGHGVYKFAFRRVKDQAPPPWEIKDDDGSESGYGGSQPDGDKDDKSDTTSVMSSDLGSPTKRPQVTSDKPEDEPQTGSRSEKDVKSEGSESTPADKVEGKDEETPDEGKDNE